MGLNRRVDIHGLFPKVRIQRDNFRAAVAQPVLPAHESAAHIWFAILNKLFPRAPDARARLSELRHTKIKRRPRQQRTTPQIAKQPPERVKRSRQWHTAAPQ